MSRSKEVPEDGARAGWPVVLAAVLPAVAYFEVWPWMVGRWFGEASYWGHGPLVPAVAAAWTFGLHRAGRLRVGGTGWPALPLAALAAAGLLLLRWRDLGFAGGVGWWCATAALLVAGAGLRGARALQGPLFFLAFMVPAPLAWVEKITFEMKFFAMRGALWLLQSFGSEARAVGSGARIRLGSGEELIVGEVCSGLRSAVTLLAIGYLVAALTRGGPWRRALVFAAAVPAAVAANVARIALLIGVASGRGVEAVASGSLVHDGSGFLVYAVAAGLLLLVARVAGLGARPREPLAAGVGRPSVIWLAAVLGLLIGGFAVGTLRRGEARARPAAVDFAALLPAEVEGLRGEDVALTPGTQRLLRADQVLYRTFGERGLLSVCIVHGTSADTRIHAPEVCYRGDGFEISAQGDLPNPHREAGFPERVREIVIDRGSERWLVWYWYLAGGRATARYADLELSALWRPEAGQGLFRLAVAVDRHGLERARARMERLLAALGPGLGKILTSL